MFSRTARMTGWQLVGVVAAIGAFVLVSAGVGSAATAGSPYQIQLDPSTPLPITAQGFSSTGSCAGIVAPEDDGWHFVVPGGFTAILSLNVSFNSPSRVVYTPDRQQAYVATLPGAQLTQASATVITLDSQAQVKNLELADTCPAGATPTPSSSPTATPGPFPGFVVPTGITNPFPVPFPSELQSFLNNPASLAAELPFLCSPPATPTRSATATPTTSATATPTTSATATPTTSATATPTTSATATPTTSATATPTTSATPTPSISASPCADPAASFGRGSPSSSASPSAGASSSTGAGATASPTPSIGAAPTPSPVASNLPVTG